MVQIAPTAPGNFLLGNIADFGHDPLQYLTTLAETYGPVVRYRLAKYDFYLVTHPDGVQRILLDNNKNYTRNGSVIWNALKPVFGSPLIISDGESWFFRRRVMQPVFVHRHVAQFTETMVGKAAAMLDRWAEHEGRAEPLDLSQQMGQMTLEMLMATIFGVETPQIVQELGEALLTQNEQGVLRARLLFYPPPWVPTPNNRRLRAALQLLDRHIYALIKEHRRNPEARTDLLGLLIQARDDETGEGLSDEQLCAEVASLYNAGHSSLSNTLLWAFYLLAQNPEAMQRLRDDVDRVLGGRPPTADDLPNLPYVQMVLYETLRLYPVGWVSVRKVIADDEILGFGIPAGAHVTISEHVTHRSPLYWNAPERFDPQRFTPDATKARHRYAWFAFLGGPHQCLGRDFVTLNAQLVLIMAAQRYRLELLPGHVAQAEPLVTQRMRGSLPMFLTRR